MKYATAILLPGLLGLSGCHGRPANEHYVRTGMYYVVEAGKGIKMKKVNSTEDYYLSVKPFVSVDDIDRCTVHDGIQMGDSYLQLQFDENGKRDLMRGTSDPARPRLALVIANRLLYVIDNYNRIETGIMKVAVNGFDEKQIEGMKEAIENKK